MWFAKFQNGFEKLRVQRFNKKPREQKAKNNGIDVKSTQYKKLAVHLLKFEILQTTWKKNHQNAKSIDEKLKTKELSES